MPESLVMFMVNDTCSARPTADRHADEGATAVGKPYEPRSVKGMGAASGTSASDRVSRTSALRLHGILQRLFVIRGVSC
ncbi:MAG: hypothetical protein K0Q54_302 [Methylobacterium brachiatum]|jgi:hypothetical protein|nr:hypothetical protein [Methylobacterium brachiatum]